MKCTTTIHRLTATEGDETLAALALAEVKHPIFGHYMLTAPFGSYGGFAFKSTAARDMLLDEARHLAEETKVEYAAIRFDEGESSPPAGWVQHPAYFTYLIDLPATPDEMLKKFSSDHRNHVRKSLKKGILHPLWASRSAGRCLRIVGTQHARVGIAISHKRISSQYGNPPRRHPGICRSVRSAGRIAAANLCLSGRYHLLTCICPTS